MEEVLNNNQLMIYHGGVEVIKYPTHQISFHTARALECLSYERSYTLR